MSKTDELEPRWPRVLGRLVSRGMLTVVLYVLSTGPVSWLLLDRSPLTNGTLDVLYFPLAWACEEAPLLDRVLRPYIEWWCMLPAGPYERTQPKATVAPSAGTMQ